MAATSRDDDEAALVELAAHAGVALENTQEREGLLASRRQITDEAAAGVQLVGAAAAMEALRSTVRRVAATELAVLLLGENGTGKEVVSQSIHYQSPRRNHPFVAVNCAALTETLLENELFGHEKGAFTDAHDTRPGKFELASGGTLFLDEIGDLSLGGQAKLLRVLEEKIVVHVGGSKNIHTDVRVIAATNQDLADLVRQKKFREDLYFRLNVVTLVLPPLRERTERHHAAGGILLARSFASGRGVRCPSSRRPARHRLESHTWPGNVRELRNLMERLAYLHPSDKIEADDLAFVLAPASCAAGLDRGRIAAGRGDRSLPGRAHSAGRAPRRRQYERSGRTARPAPLEPVSQNAATGHAGPRLSGRRATADRACDPARPTRPMSAGATGWTTNPGHTQFCPGR